LSFRSLIVGFLFRAHKEVLWFSSPFFQAALSGNWAETGRPLSMSSVITISQPPIVPGDKKQLDAPTAMTFAPVDPDLDPDELDIDISESSELEVIESSASTIVEAEKDDKQFGHSETEAQKKALEAARMESLEKLQRGAGRNSAAALGEASSPSDRAKVNEVVKLSWKWDNAETSARRQQKASNPDAVIVLKEEKV
jgi:hypothetical protein